MQANILPKYEEVRQRILSLYVKAENCYGKVLDKIVTYTQDNEGFVLIGYKDGTYTQMGSFLQESSGDIVLDTFAYPCLPYEGTKWAPFVRLGVVSGEEMIEISREMDSCIESSREKANLQTYKTLFEKYGGAHPDSLVDAQRATS